MITDNAVPLMLVGRAKDSVDALIQLADFQVSGHVGDVITLAINAYDELSGAGASAALVIDVDGSRQEFPLRMLAASIKVFSFATAGSVDVTYWARRGTLGRVAPDVGLIQELTGASVTRALTPWHHATLAKRARLCSLGSCADSTECEIRAATSSCGTVSWTVTPFYTPSDWAFDEFQSASGTGATSPITIVFSQPILAANVLIEDPTFAGNAATAYDSTGAFATKNFAYSDTAHVDHPDSTVFIGAIDSIVLTPAPADYVAYNVIVRLRPRIELAFAAADRDDHGSPIVLPKNSKAPEPQPTGLSDSVTISIDIDSAGTMLKNRTVNLTLFTVDSAGRGSDTLFGHFHHSGGGGLAKPTGQLSDTTVNTGSGTGIVGVTYHASRIAGPIIVRATSAGIDTVRPRLVVETPYLAHLDAGTGIALVGCCTTRGLFHKNNHYGTDDMVAALQWLGDSVATLSQELHVNDMSLPLGGEFDIDTLHFWSGSAIHLEHEYGISADIQKSGPLGLPASALSHVYLWWSCSGRYVFQEDSVHWHLRDWWPDNAIHLPQEKCNALHH